MPITVSSPYPTFQGNSTRKTPQNQPDSKTSAAQPRDSVLLFGSNSPRAASLQNDLFEKAGKDWTGRPYLVNGEPAVDRSSAKSALKRQGFTRGKNRWIAPKQNLTATFNKKHLTIQANGTPNEEIKIPFANPHKNAFWPF